jgi:hypothetical protein
MTHQILVCADDIYIFDINTYIIKKSTDSLLFVRKEAGIQANEDKTKYKSTFRDHSARWILVTSNKYKDRVISRSEAKRSCHVVATAFSAKTGIIKNEAR